MLTADAVSIGRTLQRMAVVIAVQGAVAADLAVGLSPLAELMACLHSMAEPEHHLEARPWLERVRATVSADSQTLLTIYAPLWARRRCRLLMPLGLPLGQTLEQELTKQALPLAEALASLSVNAVVRQNPPSVAFDKLQSLRADLRGRRCLLVPSVHARPHLIIKVEPPFPIVVHFPVENADTAERATLTQVRLRLAILSDPARLALCRHLVNEPITTSDLSVRTGMALPQVSRHLGRLREAGLLTSHRDGRMIYHRLDIRPPHAPGHGRDDGDHPMRPGAARDPYTDQVTGSSLAINH